MTFPFVTFCHYSEQFFVSQAEQFSDGLSGQKQQYPHDQILLVCDGAAWHKSKTLKVPANITMLGIPPYTPEMNPIEQIWKQLRSMGFRNEVFKTLNDVVDRLCKTICNLTNDMVKSITCRQWIIDAFLI